MTFRPPSLIQTPSSTGGDNSRGVDHHDRRLLPQSYRQETTSSSTSMTGEGSIDVMDGRTTNHSGNRRHRQHNHYHHNQSSHHRHHQLRAPDEVVDDRRRPPPTPHESNHAAASSSSNTEHDTSAAPQSQGSLSSRRRSSGLTRLSINSSGSTSGVTTTVAAAAPTPRAPPYRDEMAWLMVTRRRGNNSNTNASTNNNQMDDADVVGEEGGTGMHIVVSSPEEDDHELLHAGTSHPMTTRHMALTTTIPREHQRHFVDDDDDEDADGDVPDTADNSADGSNGGDMGGSGSITDEDLMPVEDPPGSKDEEAEKNFHLSSTSLVSSSSASSPLTPSSVVVIPRGYRLRDEFVCPITREVMVDPVMAADGHTYDRMALERWLLANSTSPKTGQPLEHLHLTPNHNLHRLLNDLFREGGQALWIRESDDLPYTLANANNTGATAENANDRNDESSYSDEPQVALILERVLKCKCLGPAESDWMGRTFRVTSQGVSGGRRRFTDASTPSASSAAPQCIQEGGVVMKKEFVQFSDATVSRKHFDITFEKDQTKDDATATNKRKQSKMVAGKFVLRDLGSAGGTFVRIPPWQPTVLKAGMRIMVGKHQLEVLAPPPRTNQSRSSSRRRTRTSPKSCHHGSKGIDNNTSASTGINVTGPSTTRGGHHSRANTGVSVLSLPQVTSVASTVSSNNGGDILAGEEGMMEMDESNLMALREYDHHQQQQEQDDDNGAASQNPHHRRDSSSVAAAAVAASGCGCTSSSSSNTALKHQGVNNTSSNPTSGSGGGSNTRRNSQDLHQPPSRSNQHPTTKRGSNNNNNTSPLEEITSRTDVNTPKYTSDTAAIAAMMSRFEFCGGSGGGGSGTASASMPSSPMDAAAPSSVVEGATAAIASSLNDHRLQQQPRGMSNSDTGNEEDVAVVPQEERTNLDRDVNGTHHGRLRRGKTTKTTPIGANNVESGCECGEEGENNENDEEHVTDEGEGLEEENNDDEPLLILRCYAPEGTPIQGREYPVGRKGATLGRKAQNTISFSHTVKQVISVPAATPATGDGIQQEEREQVVENVVGIDSSISGEHATILYNPKTQQLELQDGACPPSSRLDDNNGNRNRRFNKNSSAVGSTNGTWVRLSGMHEESQPFTLEDNSTEILIGTVRFLVTLEDAIVERDYYSHHCK